MSNVQMSNVLRVNVTAQKIKFSIKDFFIFYEVYLMSNFQMSNVLCPNV